MSAFLSTFAFKPERDVETAHIKAEFIFETLLVHLLFGEDPLMEMFTIVGFDEAIVFRGEETEWTAIHYRDILKGASKSISRIVGDEANKLFQSVAERQEVDQEELQEVIGQLPDEQQGMMTSLLGALPGLLGRKKTSS
jgi:hypothetical protein